MHSDKEILRQIATGNNSLFEKVFHEHYAKLVNFANNFLLDTKLSEDIVQDVLIYLWENSKSIHINNSLKTYLYQAVKNSCLNQLRALKLKDKHELIYIEAILKTANKELIDTEEIMRDVQSALSKLPKQMYNIFYKKYFQELSIKEIAEEMSLSEGTIKVQLHRGRISIRHFMKVATSYIFF